MNNTKDTNKRWILDYNEDQDKFHVEEADNRFYENREKFIKNESNNNWMTLGVFDSYYDAVTYKENIVEKKIFLSDMLSLEEKGKLKFVKYDKKLD